MEYLFNILSLIIACIAGAAISYFIIRKKRSYTNILSVDNTLELHQESNEEQVKKECEQDLIGESSGVDLAGVELLKTNYKLLQDEIEDYQDDIADCKERLKSKEEENAELQNEIDDCKKKLKSKEEENAEFQNEIDDCKEKPKSREEENVELQNEIADCKKQLKSREEENAELQNEIADCKKQLKSKEEENAELQDEIEDYQDDIADCKKKLKSEEEENAELQEQVEKKERAAVQLLNELEQLKAESEEKTNELDLKKKSLNFIQEVLTAKQDSDASVKNFYGKVDLIVNFISGELRDCIKETFPEVKEKETFKSDLNRWAVTRKKTWIQKKSSIAFVGEFSAGKTSIVNRILSQDNPAVPTLPVSMKATTAIPTYISGGVRTGFQFFSSDNILKNISESTFKRVNKEILDQVNGVSSLIQYFVMTYKNENLNNLSILDTPGFNSNDKEDSERTIGVINECDALFWVFDVNAGTVNKSSINLIREHLKKPLYVIINKVDTKTQSEVDSVARLIEKTLQDERIDIKGVIRFSSKTPLDEILKLIQSIRRDTCQESYINNLKEMIDSLINRLDKTRKENKEKYKTDYEKETKLTDSFLAALDELAEHCQNAAEIPQWKEYFFSKNRYEMTDEEGEQLMSILNSIAGEQLNNLNDISKKLREAAESSQEAYSNYKDAVSNYNKLDEHKEQLTKLLKTM